MTKTVPSKSISTNLNEQKVICKMKKLYFTCFFINYNDIFNSCQYLLLHHKILSKTKTFTMEKKLFKAGNKNVNFTTQFCRGSISNKFVCIDTILQYQ